MSFGVNVKLGGTLIFRSTDTKIDMREGLYPAVDKKRDNDCNDFKFPSGFLLFLLLLVSKEIEVILSFSTSCFFFLILPLLRLLFFLLHFRRFLTINQWSECLLKKLNANEKLKTNVLSQFQKLWVAFLNNISFNFSNLLIRTSIFVCSYPRNLIY